MDSLIVANLKHRLLRTIISIVGVALGVCLMVLTVGLCHGLIKSRAEREANLGAEIMVRELGAVGLKTWSDLMLPVQEADELRHIEGIEAVAPVGHYFVTTKSGFGLGSIEGIPTGEYQAVSHITMVEGRSINNAGHEAIVDVVYAETHQLTPGDEIELFGQTFRVVGIYTPESGPRVKIPLAAMQQYTGFSNRCSTFLVKCRNPEEQELIARRIQDRFPERQALLTRDLPAIYARGTPALTVFLNVVVALDAVISTLVILLTMYTTIKERTREIGILKSLGASKAFIAGVIEKEAFLISSIGVLFGFAVSLLARVILQATTDLTVAIEAKWVLIAALIGIGSGLVGSLYPALSATHQDAVKALSYE